MTEYSPAGGGFWPARVTVSGDDFRYRYWFGRQHLPWKAINRFDLERFDRLRSEYPQRRVRSGVRLILIKTTDERGVGATVHLAGMEWADKEYAEAVRIRDWLNGYVERHGRRHEGR